MKEVLLIAAILLGISSNAQVKKDTLYFSYDREYIVEYNNGERFSIKDTRDDEEYLVFFRGSAYHKLNPDNVLDLKSFIINSSFYDSNRQKRLNEYRLIQYLNLYELFLVEKGKDDTIEFTKLFPATVIID